MLDLIRKIRHGPLKSLNPFWLFWGNFYRYIFTNTNLYFRHKVGPFGPFHLHARFAFSNFEQWGKGHNDAFEVCINTCRNKKCILDVGAHIGLVTLSAASVAHKEGKVIAFEPAEFNRQLLKKHVKENKFCEKIIVESSLVGDFKSNSVDFYELDEDTGMNSIVPITKNQEYKKNVRKQITLDEYCSRHNLSPEVIKIDVEGAELRVLKGAKNTISKYKPIIFLSVHPKLIKQLNESTDELKDLINILGYEYKHSDGSDVNDFALREYILSPNLES